MAIYIYIYFFFFFGVFPVAGKKRMRKKMYEKKRGKKRSRKWVGLLPNWVTIQ